MVDTCKITVDEHEIECNVGSTLLDVCLANGIYIPSLCSHPAIKSIGACRLCIVEIEGETRPVASCTVKVKDGMNVRTNSTRIAMLRRLAMELILSEHPEDCSSCPKYGNCILQSVIQYVGAGNGRLRSVEKIISPIKANPLFVHDMYRCIKCGRCIRVCRDVRGVGVLKYYKDEENDLMVGTGKMLLKDTDCRFCGACAEICPTGAIRDKEGLIDRNRPKEASYVPCRDRCPAHVDIPSYIRAIHAGNLELAGKIIRQKVIFPRTIGHICTHSCEQVCRRGEVNQPVSICGLKKSIPVQPDLTKEFDVNEPTGKRVAIIGSGPAGLSAAFRLVRYGNSVEVFEKLPEPGGMLRYGIPEFRLPQSVLACEIEALVRFGISIKTNSEIKNPAQLLEKGFDAVLVSVGTHKGTVLPIPGHAKKGIIRNIEFLRDVRMGRKPEIGKRTVVLGGGSVAFDCALTAKKFGAEEITVICVESRNRMRATSEEIQEAEKEGIKIINDHTFVSILGDDSVSGVEIVPVLGISKDSTGAMQLETDSSASKIIDVDNIIFAVGQKPEGIENMGLEMTAGEYIAVDESSMTSMEGIFAAGDVVTGTRSVIEALVNGGNAADAIARYLGNAPIQDSTIPVEREGRIGVVQGFSSMERMNLSDFGDMCSFMNESGRCLQCDLRLDIEPQKFWTDFKTGGQNNVG